MAYTLLDIASFYDRNYKTTARHIKELKDKGLFEKKSYGKQFSEDEVQSLQQLLGFKRTKHR